MCHDSRGLDIQTEREVGALPAGPLNRIVEDLKRFSFSWSRKNEAASQPQEAYVPKKLDDLKGANNTQQNNSENNVQASNNAHPKQENGLFPFNNNSTSLHLITGIFDFSLWFYDFFVFEFFAFLVILPILLPVFR